EVPSGKPATPPEGHPGHVLLTGFLPDGDTLLSASADGLLCYSDTASGKERRRLTLGEDSRRDFVFDRHHGFALSPDGQQLATVEDARAATVWDLPSGKPLYELEEAGGRYWAVRFSPDGRLLGTGARNGILRVWEAATGTLVGKVNTQAGWINTLAFSPDG